MITTKPQFKNKIIDKINKSENYEYYYVFTSIRRPFLYPHRYPRKKTSL